MQKKLIKNRKAAKLFDEIQQNAGVEPIPSKKGLHWYSYVLIFVDICALVCFFFAYGPIDFFRSWLVTTAMGTGQHKYFAYVLYSRDQVNEIVASNGIGSTDGISDVGDIEMVDYSNVATYANAYEQQILEKDEGNDLYKVIEFSEGTYSGYITVIYQPTLLDLFISQNKYGNQVSEMAQQAGALVAINGGGYTLDDDYVKYPNNIIISNHSIYYDTGVAEPIVGMNDDGVLMLMNSSAQEAVDAGMKWGLSFGPFLIVNGKAAAVTGNGGGGYQPRTVIAQRKDGIVLLLTVDGRGGNGSLGASFGDLIEVLQKYGAYNACNLDGGGSTVLVVENELVNHPVSYQGTGERNVLDAIVLLPDE